MINRSKFFLVLTIIACNLQLCLSLVQPYKTADDCAKDGQNFNPFKFECEACPSGQINDGVIKACECPANHFKVSKDGEKLECLQCNKLSPDGTSCLSSQLESCPNDQFLYEREISGEKRPNPDCRQCSRQYTVDINHLSCVPCDSPLIDPVAFDQGNTCTCSANHAKFGGKCYPTSDIDTFDSQTTKLSTMHILGEARTLNSEPIQSFAKTSYLDCKMNQDLDACSLLSTACMHNFIGTQIPNSLCSSIVEVSMFEPIVDAADSTRINIRNEFYTAPQPSSMELLIAVYNVTGHYLGLKDVTTGLLQPCKHGGSGYMSAGFFFGNNFNKKLYIRHSSTRNGPKLMYSVPVVITTAKGTQNTPQGMAMFRFVVIDKLLLSATRVTKNEPAQYIRYAKSMVLSFNLIGQDQISPPILNITYADVLTSDPKTQISLNFKIEYTENQESFDQVLLYTGIVFLFLSILWSLADTASFNHRQAKDAGGLNTRSVVHFFAAFCSAYSFLVFLLIFGAALWYLVVFKFQRDAVLVLPAVDSLEEKRFVYVIVSLAVAKFLHVVYIIIRQIQSVVFFLDWEQPKVSASRVSGGGVTGAPPKKPGGLVTGGRSETPAPNDGSARPGTGLGHVGGGPAAANQLPPTTVEDDEQVSVWRTLFIANEFSELSVLRNMTPEIQLLATLILCHAIGLENVATADSYKNLNFDDDSYHAEPSRILRFAIIAACYLGFAFLHWIGKVLIKERFKFNSATRFLDLMYFANISIIVLPFDRYGYYLYGKCAYGSADRSMQHLLAALGDPNLARGPVTKTAIASDNQMQAFKIYIPDSMVIEFAAYIREILAFKKEGGGAQAEITATHRPGAGEGGGDVQGVDKAALSKADQAHKRFRDWLAKEVEGNFHHADPTASMSSLGTVLEELVDIDLTQTIDHNQAQHKQDVSQQWRSIMFLGNEHNLLFLELLIVCLADVVLLNATGAVCIAYGVSVVLTWFREEHGVDNLAMQTRVDPKFLW